MVVAQETANPELEGLAFQLFLWIAGRGQEISPRAVQVFLRMLDHCGWCQSRWARENLHRTHERYAEIWNAQALAGANRDLEALLGGLRRLRQMVTVAEAPLVRADLLRLAEATARASGGLWGQAAMRREQREALLVFSALAADLLLAPEQRSGRSGSDQGRSDEGAVDPRPAPVAAAPAPVAGAREASAPQKRPLRIRCVQVIDETHDVKTFRFSLEVEPGGRPRFTHKPGQFITLDLAIDGERMRRSYTIASSPSRPQVLEITIKRVLGGRVSNWLHDHLGVGDELGVSGPSGKFSCEAAPTGEKLLFISGGSGITPVMSMSRYLHDTGDPRDVIFLHSARAARDLVFRDELRLIAARHPRFRTIFTLTESATDDWAGLRGRVSRRLIEDAVPDFRDRTVFLCGPTPFMDAVKAFLAEAEFPMASFHAESFGGPRALRASAASGTTPLPERIAGELPGPSATTATSAERTPARPPSDSRSRSSQLLDVLPRPRISLPLAARAARPANDPAAVASGAAGTGSSPGAVVFSSSGQEVRGGNEATILETAEALGLSIPSACRAGVCGTCKTRKLSGNVKMDCEDGLDPDDRQAGFILPCTARPLDRVTVEA